MAGRNAAYTAGGDVQGQYGAETDVVSEMRRIGDSGMVIGKVVVVNLEIILFLRWEMLTTAFTIPTIL